MDKDEIYPAEIKEFCQKIIGYTANLSYEQFLVDEKLQLAVVKLSISGWLCDAKLYRTTAPSRSRL